MWGFSERIPIRFKLEEERERERESGEQKVIDQTFQRCSFKGGGSGSWQATSTPLPIYHFAGRHFFHRSPRRRLLTGGGDARGRPALGHRLDLVKVEQEATRLLSLLLGPRRRAAAGAIFMGSARWTRLHRRQHHLLGLTGRFELEHTCNSNGAVVVYIIS